MSTPITNVDLRCAVKLSAFHTGARPLPVRRVRWMKDRIVTDVCGRQRSRATFSAHRKGKAPANKGKTYPAQPLTAEEVVALLNACSRTPYGLRDRALMGLLWRSGLRIHEALRLWPDDLNEAAHTIVVRRGKGGKYGVSAMDDAGWDLLRPWLELRGAYPAGPVFCTLQGPTVGGPMGSPQFRLKLKSIAARAGVTKRVHPHGFRHTHAVDLASEGVHLHLVSRQLRHTNIATTATYLAGIAPVEVINAVAARVAPAALLAASNGEPSAPREKETGS